ncbi:hypothetical protein Glove_159g15 [Diversispora epigaea]|uniref:Uncharacterized protein n=1 Tax=Diversispora epigaea TaxID=1348612 RepID=A0A397IV75_9GLOM|nr:hypothetical protein Glove_159g15 [Diversispora epigaea]
MFNEKSIEATVILEYWTALDNTGKLGTRMLECWTTLNNTGTLGTRTLDNTETLRNWNTKMLEYWNSVQHWITLENWEMEY